MSLLRIAVLGKFRVSLGTRSFELPEGSARLLAYVALSFGRLTPRSQVAGTLWPDLPEGRAKANLSTVLWRLKVALRKQGCPVTVFRSTGTALGLNSGWAEVDAELFKRDSGGHGASFLSLDSLSRAVHAVGFYNGELLEDWDVDWCVVEREELRNRYLATLRNLAEGFERFRRHDLALRFARKAAEADPFSEPVQRMLMRLLNLAGDRAAAIEQFNRFASKSRRELGVEPSIETLKLLNEIRSNGRESTPWRSGRLSEVPLIAEKVPIVGRAAERHRLGAFLQGALSGDGGGLLILGDNGVGKSRLVEWGMEEWVAGGGRAVLGRCIQFNVPVPYQPILEPLCSIVEIGDLIGLDSRTLGDFNAALYQLSTAEIGGSGAGARSFAKLRLFSRLGARLIGASRRRPVLLVVEDLQWADAGSVDLLAFLLERLRGTHVAIMVTSRPVGSSARRLSSVERVARHCVESVRLTPLSEADTRRLVQSLLEPQDVPRGLASLIYAEAEGNPLFVIETLHLLRQQQGSLHGVSGHADSGCAETLPDHGNVDIGLGIPNGVRSAVQQRLALISPPSLKIASVASVLGRSFDEELLATIAGLSANRLSKAIAHLLYAGVLEREGAGYRFAHDKIRAVCYEEIPARVRRLYHARAAAALAQMPETPSHPLAWHQLSAGQWSLAVGSWKKAGDYARGIYAHEDALHAYRYAVYCVRRDKTREAAMRIATEAALLFDQEDVLAILGRPSERLAILERVRAISKQALAAPVWSTLLARKARLEDHVGNFAEAARLARRAWAIARGAGDRLAQGEALRVLAWTLSRAGRYGRSLAVSRLALRELNGVSSALTVTVLWQAAVASIWLGDHPAAATLLKRARAVSIESGLAAEDPVIFITQAVLDKWSGNVCAARAGLVTALHLSEEAGDLAAVTRATCSLAILNCLEGRLGDAILQLRKALVTSRATEHTRNEATCLNTVASGIGRLIGNYRWAWNASCHAIRLLVNAGGAKLAAFYRDSQAQLLLEEGRSGEARELANTVLQSFESERGYSLHAELLARRGRIRLDMAHLEGAVHDLETARAIQQRAGERLQLVDTLTYLALAYARQGEAERALATSEEAIRLLTEIHYANLQPQRIFWHHFLILEQFDREPRVDYLRRAVALIEERGATLSCAQRRRFRQDVALNRDILDAWERCQGIEGHQASPTELVAVPERVAAAPAATAGALSAVPGS